MQNWMWIDIGVTSGAVVVGVIIVLLAVMVSHGRANQ